MRTFLITYDLHNSRNYLPLYELLHEWRAVRLTESLWLAKLKGPAAAIRNIVQQRLDGDDTVAVLEMKLGADWATFNVAASVNDYLSSNVTTAELSHFPARPIVETPPVALAGMGLMSNFATLSGLGGIR